MNTNFYSLLCFFLATAQTQAQTTKQDSLRFSAFGEVYYAIDFPSSTSTNERADFLYNHKRERQATFNLLLLSGQYERKHFRANLGLMAGSYARYNLAGEPHWMKYIYEANLGIKLSKNKNLWLDMGILPSHIGFESVLSQDCYTLTRSLVAENSPYYESGLKLSHELSNSRWYWAILLLNGWQRMNFDPTQKTPSLGIQVQNNVNKKLMVNYSNFIGKVQADHLNAWRFYHNLYLQYKHNPNLSLCLGFDLGSDFAPTTQSYGLWYTPVFIGQHKMNKKWAIASRAEYFSDARQIILTHAFKETLGIWGFSVNADYRPHKKILLRGETKMYHSSVPYFSLRRNQWCCTSSLCFWL